MYERFSDRARKVRQLAQEEARRLNHEYIGTEHILLGLVKEGSGVAANALKNLDVDLRKIRLDVEMLVKSGPSSVTFGRIPQTPSAKKVIELAIDESRKLAHQYVGTDHILLGLLLEPNGVAGQVLRNLGLTYDLVKDALNTMIAVDVMALENSGTTTLLQDKSAMTWLVSLALNKASSNSGLFVIRSCATSGDGKKQYWSCSPEHGTGWCATPKQSFTKSELAKQVFDLIDNGHFQNCEILELHVPE